MTDKPAQARDQGAVLKFIERFAGALTEAGFPRMPARVFVALFASDSGHLTAGELAEQLQVSPAAISGAVRYLTQVNLAIREREPGARQDRFRVEGNVWYELMRRRDRELARWEDSLREGIDALGRDTPAGAKLAATLPFFEFMQKELSEMLERWQNREGSD
ncbi:GbsR/MarR family transcriptional regulator [Streptomyces sp. NPDC020192]|uniref:GbsR/MarR family transcriptional regulator n=1 Tax=Streptomyces sp. NPDC020192 TaxID=3365066 RepID=UPI0037969BD5